MKEKSESEDLKKDLDKVKRWFDAVCLYEKDWRHKARVWFDYFHGDQLPQDVILAMKARKQPPIKFNLIKSIVNLLTGQEIQGRTDTQFLGVEESDDIKAEILTEIYRQSNHASNFDYEMTDAFQDGVIGGRGVIFEEWGSAWDSDENDIIREYVDWKEVYVDPASKRDDFSDANHVFRVKWVDLDVAKDMFPDSIDILNKLTLADEDQDYMGGPSPKSIQREDYFDEVNEDGSVRYYDAKRSRVKFIECWWKVGKKIMNGTFCQEGWLEQPDTYDRKHNLFPFVFTFYDRDSYGCPYGLVKDLIDPQDVVNRMLSKSMHVLGTNQVFAEKGALKNTARVQEEIAKPDAVINDFEDGSLAQGKVIINNNMDKAGLAFQHFEVGINAMHRISGVNPELQGLNTNARSGTAISMRLRQGNTVLTKLYDCLEKTKKNVAKRFVYLMAQYYTQKKIVRYKMPNGMLQEVELNGEAIEQVEVNGKLETAVFKVNTVEDIFKYDIVITESAKAGNQNESEFVQMVELFKAVPQAITPGALQELIKSTHLPNKEELARALQPQQPAGDGQPTSLELVK